MCQLTKDCFYKVSEKDLHLPGEGLIVHPTVSTTVKCVVLLNPLLHNPCFVRTPLVQSVFVQMWPNSLQLSHPTLKCDRSPTVTPFQRCTSHPEKLQTQRVTVDDSTPCPPLVLPLKTFDSSKFVVLTPVRELMSISSLSHTFTIIKLFITLLTYRCTFCFLELGK